MLKLNLGCGLQCPESWVNIDSSVGVRISKRPLLKKILYAITPKSWGILPNIKWPSNTKWMDLTKPFNYTNNSVDCVYSSHTFEHFSYAESTFVFSECYRVMKKGAIIRIIVPDFEVVINNYLKAKMDDPDSAALLFTEQSGYFEIPPPNSLRGLFKFYFQRKNNHRFLYDEAALRSQMIKAGFNEVKRMKFKESRFADAGAIDIESRFNNALCMEGIKL